MGVSSNIALVFAGISLSVLAAGCSSGGGSGASTSTTSTTTTPPAASASLTPAVPCQSSTKGSTAASTTTATPPKDPSWTGVFERVHVHLEGDGSPKDTPHQFTIVSASGHGPVTVAVPVSSSNVHRRSSGKKAHVVDGKAEVELDPNGTASERLDSDYTLSLPVAVKVTYKLNGSTVSSSQIKGKSGSVEVDYQLTNTTSKSVTVCFKGFNGKLVKQTVVTPEPILAYLSFTVPRDATSFKAQGASLAPARHGISASWLTSMFEPLGPTTQTFVFTAEMKKASIPSATVLLETLDPLSISGKAAATAASGVANAQAAAAQATAKVQSDVAAIQLKASQSGSSSGKSHGSQFDTSRGSKPDRNRSSHGGKSTHLDPAASSSILPGLEAQVAGLQTQVAGLSRANRTFARRAGQSSATVSTASSVSADELTASTSRSIAGLAAAASTSLDGLTAGMRQSLDALNVELRRPLDTRSIKATLARAARLRAKVLLLRRHAAALRAENSLVQRSLDALVTSLPATAQTALREVAKLNKLETDLDALSAAEQALPEIQALVQDLNDAQTVAGAVSSQLSGLQARARALDGPERKLQSDTVALQTRIAELQTMAVANAKPRVQRSVAHSLQSLGAQFGAAQSKAAQDLAAAELGATRSVSSAEQSARTSLSSAQQRAARSVASTQQKAARRMSKAERRIDRLTASAQRALAKAKQEAKQGGETGLAALQAASNQAEAAAASALAKTDASYGRLLTLEQQAIANQLPGGDANVTVQNGSFLYSIAGT
jgi:hypothetical protein